MVEVEDLQNQVREHIKQDLFHWDEALTDEEMIFLEQLLLTFAPMFYPGSIGFEKTVKPFLQTSSENYWKQRCEAAEEYTYVIMSRVTEPMTDAEERYFNQWQQLKNNPAIESDDILIIGKTPYDEWLDESIEPCATSSRIEELEKENKRLTEVVAKLSDEYNQLQDLANTWREESGN